MSAVSVETSDRPSPRPWGLEITKTHIWLGPMRKDRSGKVSEIVCAFDIENITPSGVALHMANAKHIIECVNRDFNNPQQC